MSNTGYHANGKPSWWARVEDGPHEGWVEIPAVRGDKKLDCVVELPVGTKVYCGAGKGSFKTHREHVVTEAIEDSSVPATTPRAAALAQIRALMAEHGIAAAEVAS